MAGENVKNTLLFSEFPVKLRNRGLLCNLNLSAVTCVKMES